MALRLQRAQASAMVLAGRLAAHLAVELARYFGLASQPTHAAAKRGRTCYETIISLDVPGGAEATDAVHRKVGLIRHATSLGAAESTMGRCAAISGQGHVPSSQLRTTVGIYDVEDLWRDLDAALCSASDLRWFACGAGAWRAASSAGAGSQRVAG
jgi:cystathionine gamma-synthase